MISFSGLFTTILICMFCFIRVILCGKLYIYQIECAGAFRKKETKTQKIYFHLIELSWLLVRYKYD